MQKTHGQTTLNGKRTPSRIYKCWANMIQRCTNPKNTAYKNYGGRGIKVCERWRKSFTDFYADMGHPSDSKATIDRIENNGNYEPSNCRWTDANTQAQNSRRAVMVTIHGETRAIAAWLRINNLPYVTCKQRRRNGWMEQVLCGDKLAIKALWWCVQNNPDDYNHLIPTLKAIKTAYAKVE